MGFVRDNLVFSFDTTHCFPGDTCIAENSFNMGPSSVARPHSAFALPPL
jgi:hypothetical protein